MASFLILGLIPEHIVLRDGNKKVWVVERITNNGGDGLCNGGDLIYIRRAMRP